MRYAAVVPDGTSPVVSDESEDVRWWPVGALPEGPQSDVGGLVAAAGALLTPR